MTHVAILRRVRAGCEAEFERALDDFFREALAEGATSGAQLIRPLPGATDRVYGVLRSFPGEHERDAFYASALFQRWNERVRPLVEEGAADRREFHGLEAFFRATAPAGGPPAWKLAVTTWVGVTLVTSLVIPTLGPVLGGWGLGFLVSNALLNVVIVATLTWVVMPILTRWVARWLTHPAR